MTGSSGVRSHFDVVVHGRKFLFMMHECQCILNGDVAGVGLWEVDLLASAAGEGGGVVAAAAIHGAGGGCGGT